MSWTAILWTAFSSMLGFDDGTEEKSQKDNVEIAS